MFFSEKAPFSIPNKSAINNKSLRSLNRQIRDEYQKLIPSLKLKLYFVFGKQETGMDILDEELTEFDDLIIADFTDIYNNLPLKVNLLFLFCFEFYVERFSLKLSE